MAVADIPNEEMISLPSAGQRFALVVGCNNSSCVPPNWATLRSAEKDARDVAYHLEQSTSGFKLLRPAIIGKDATVPNIRQAMKELVKEKTEDDFLLFYFSGHAQPMKNNVFFVTHDFYKEEVELDPNWYLSMRWLWDVLYRSKGAGSILIILDCCYAGNLAYAREDFLQIDLRARLDAWDTGTNGETQPNQSRLILAAAGYNTQAEEVDEQGQMTKWIIRALAGNIMIMDTEGNVDVYYLHRFLINHMPQGQISPLSGEVAKTYVLACHPALSASYRKTKETSLLEKIYNHVTTNAESSMKPKPQSFDKSLCSDATFDDLDQEKVADFLKKEPILKEENFLPGVSHQEQLSRLSLFRKSYPTYGTLLCFAQNPSQWVPSAFTRCIDSSNSDNPDQWQGSKKYRKGLLSQFEESCSFLIKRLDSSRVIGREGSLDRLEIPFIVLREALANALIHRDYERTDFIVVELFHDRVEISNPGDLPQNITLELLQKEHSSHPRNPQIADIFHLYGHVEERGKGIERMQRFMAEVGLPAPKFEISGDKRFKVILYRPTRDQLPTRLIQISGERSVMIGGTYYGQVIPVDIDIPTPTHSFNKDALIAAEQQLAALPLDSIPLSASLPPDSLMHLRRNPLFVGRGSDLLTLAAMLKSNRGETIAVTGLGGIGKTQLVNEFVYRYGQFFAGGVFWLEFSKADTVPAQIAACGGPGGLNLPDFENRSLEDQVSLVLSVWRNPLPRLLVYDNCEDEKLFHMWQPITGGSRILITSRRAVWNPFLGVEMLHLNVLMREESIELLRKFRPDLAADDPDLYTIATELGDLPLALHIAGSYLKQYHHTITLAEYIVRLNQPFSSGDPSLLQDKSQLTSISPTDHVQDLSEIFVRSYEQLDRDNPIDALALKLLARAAYFTPDEPISRHLLLATLHLNSNDFNARLQASDALSRLAALGLLQITDQGTFLLHRLLVPLIHATIETATNEEAQAAVENIIGEVPHEPA